MKRSISIIGSILLAAALCSPAFAKPGNGKGGGNGGGGGGKGVAAVNRRRVDSRHWRIESRRMRP